MKTLAILLCLILSILDASADSRVLGLSAPLSGGGAGWGNDVKNVLLFANEKLAQGRYRFVFEDDRCDPKTSLSVARKMISVDKVREVFIVCGQSVTSTAKVYTSAGVLVMASLATPSQISGMGVFRTSLSDEFATRKLAEYIAAHHRSIVVFTEENDYSVSFFRDFERNAKGRGLAVTNENYLPDKYDFKTQLLKFKKAKAEALFLNTQTEEALATIVKQLHEIDFAPALYGAYLPGSAGFLKLIGDKADGLIFVDFPGASDLLTPEGDALYKEYVARFGPLQGWSFVFPATFEAFRAVHLGIESGKSIAPFLRATKFHGLFGDYSFDAHGDVVGPQHLLRIIRKNSAEKLNS